MRLNQLHLLSRPHKKAVSTLLRITFKGHSWIDPGDDIDLTAIPLWVRVGETPLEILVVATRNRPVCQAQAGRGIISNGVNPCAEFNATTGFIYNTMPP